MTAERSAPLERSSFPPAVEMEARWNDVDIFGHLNNAVFYEIFDTAILRMLTGSGAITRDGPRAALVVESGAHFHSEVLFVDKLSVALRVAHIGSSSVRYDIAAFVGEAPISAVDGYVIHVFVDRATRRPVPIPDSVRGTFERLRYPSAP